MTSDEFLDICLLRHPQTAIYELAKTFGVVLCEPCIETDEIIRNGVLKLKSAFGVEMNVCHACAEICDHELGKSE